MRYIVEFDYCGWAILDTTIEEDNCCVGGSVNKEEAEAECKRLNEEDQNECDHKDHDHGMCLYCGKDIMDDLISAAEYRCEGDR